MDERATEQVGIIESDIADLDVQVAAGEIDSDTAARLRSRYEGQLNHLLSVAGDDDDVLPQEHETRTGIRRLDRRAVAGISVVLVAVVIIAVSAVNALSGSTTSGVQGLASDVVTGQGTVDLSGVSNEQMESVVAENPEVVGMRLALARRYFEEGDFENALRHYFVILEIEKNPEALANVGWMTYVSGRPDVALGYVEASLERAPGSITATWFLGNIQYALGNFDEAAVALVAVVGTEGVPDDVRELAESLLRDMEGS